MKQRQRLGILLAALLLLPFSLEAATVTDQQTISVSAVVQAPPPPEEPETIVQFNGLAYPDAEVSIERNGSDWLTVSANTQAAFSVQSEILPGTYTFTFRGADTQGTAGPPLSISLTISEGSTVTVSNIFLGPTMSSDAASIPLNGQVAISGFTVPNSQLTLYADGPEGNDAFTTFAGEDGRWSITLRGGVELESEGTYQLRSRARAPDTSLSEYSTTLVLLVTEASEPDPCDFANIADLNCDGAVDLVDFSILLYYWLDTSPGNPRADINRNGIVDVVDFSIMMYHWTG